MAKSPAEDIGTHLDSLGTFSNIFINNAPDSPDNSIEINDTAGVPPMDTMGTATNKPFIENPGIQVRVRNKNNNQAASTMYDVFQALHGLSTTIDGVRYYSVLAVQSPFFIFKDENERFYYGCNFLIKRDFDS